jgi:hypothetical protein
MRDRSPKLLPTGSLGLLVLAVLASQIVSCSDNVTGPTAFVDGVVQLRDGPPLPGVVVSFSEPTNATPLLTHTTTDANGRFSLLLPAGVYEVWVRAAADSGVMSQQVASVTVQSSHVSLDLHYSGYRVRGMITSLGLGLASGYVLVLDGTNTARADLRDNGAPRFSERTYSLLLPAGTFDFWANPNEGYWGVPRVKFEGITVSSDTTIDLACDGHFVRGTVTGPGGVIIYGATVSATAPGASAFDYTTSIGTYGVHLPDGEYVFTVTPPSGADTLQTLTVPGVLIDAPRTLDLQLSHTP